MECGGQLQTAIVTITEMDEASRVVTMPVMIEAREVNSEQEGHTSHSANSNPVEHSIMHNAGLVTYTAVLVKYNL